jgi:hypothetical protein
MDHETKPSIDKIGIKIYEQINIYFRTWLTSSFLDKTLVILLGFKASALEAIFWFNMSFILFTFL